MGLKKGPNPIHLFSTDITAEHTQSKLRMFHDCPPTRGKPTAMVYPHSTLLIGMAALHWKVG